MYFKERDLVKYSDGRVFIVRKATEEFAVLTMLTQLENTNEYFYTGVNITALNNCKWLSVHLRDCFGAIEVPSI